MDVLSQQEISLEVNKIFAELFELPSEKLRAESHLFNDLGLDSLDAIDMAIRFKRDFNLQATSEDMKSIQTLGDIYALVERFLPTMHDAAGPR